MSRLAGIECDHHRARRKTDDVGARFDPLRSEGRHYADRLKEAGVPVAYRNYAGVTHEFFGMGAVVDKAKQAVTFAASELRQSFSHSPTSALHSKP